MSYQLKVLLDALQSRPAIELVRSLSSESLGLVQMCVNISLPPSPIHVQVHAINEFYTEIFYLKKI